MARRSAPDEPRPAQLSAEQMQQGIARLQRRIEELEKFDVSPIEKRWSSPEVKGLETAIDETLGRVYGAGTIEYRRYQDAGRLDHGPLIMNHYDSPHDVQQYLREGITQSITLLKQAIKGLEEDLADRGPTSTSPAPLPTEPLSPKRIFVVHGHDEGARETVARFLSKAGLEPIILHEQASGGRTVIEKLEYYSDVGFAIVILTPDDEGGVKDSGKLNPRARQNVIAELFYFIGKLTRARVRALIKGEVEIPSDIGGVVYVSMDDRGAWKTELLRELANEKYIVDWAKALG